MNRKIFLPSIGIAIVAVLAVVISLSANPVALDKQVMKNIKGGTTCYYKATGDAPNCPEVGGACPNVMFVRINYGREYCETTYFGKTSCWVNGSKLYCRERTFDDPNDCDDYSDNNTTGDKIATSSTSCP